MVEGAYLHAGSDAPLTRVVGVAEEEIAVFNALWLQLGRNWPCLYKISISDSLAR